MPPLRFCTALLLATTACVAAAQPSGCESFAGVPAFAQVQQTCQALVAVLPQQQLPPRLDCASLAGEAGTRCVAFRRAAEAAMQQPDTAAAYADYRNKAAVLAAWVDSLAMRLAVMQFHGEQGRFPASPAELDMTPPPRQVAEAVTLHEQGVIVVSLPARLAAGAELHGLPTVQNGLIDYRCQARHVPARWLPSACLPDPAMP